MCLWHRLAHKRRLSALTRSEKKARLRLQHGSDIEVSRNIHGFTLVLPETRRIVAQMPRLVNVKSPGLSAILQSNRRSCRRFLTFRSCFRHFEVELGLACCARIVISSTVMFAGALNLMEAMCFRISRLSAAGGCVVRVFASNPPPPSKPRGLRDTFQRCFGAMIPSRLAAHFHSDYSKPQKEKQQWKH